MHRRHLFPLVVLLAAAVVAGLLALTRTVDLGQPVSASTGSDAAIAARLQELDSFEASLRRQLADAGSPAVAPTTVYRRAAAPASRAASSDHEDEEHEDDDEHEEHDD